MMLIDKIPLKFEEDILYIIATSRKVGIELHLNPEDQNRFTTALSEICQNSFKHAGEAEVSLSIEEIDNKQFLIAEIMDEVPQQGNNTSPSNEYGKGKNRAESIEGPKKMVDFLDIKQENEKRTIITFGIYLIGINGSPPLSPEEITRAKDKIKMATPENPPRQVRQQNDELKKAYSEIKKREEELEILNKQQENLIRKLEDKNQELKDFAKVVSHDLKNPLSGIKGLAEILNKKYLENLDDRGKEIVGMIISATGKMNHLINGVLKYSQANVDDEDTISKLDPNVILRDIMELLDPEEKVELEADNLPVVYYNPTELHQIFQNLVANAIKYNDKKKVKIKIAAKKENENFLFSVTDNGPGIKEEDWEKAFGLFKTLGSKQDVEPGTGIGLPLVKKIIKKNDGEIWIESKVGHETTFFFTIPAGKRK